MLVCALFMVGFMALLYVAGDCAFVCLFVVCWCFVFALSAVC